MVIRSLVIFFIFKSLSFASSCCSGAQTGNSLIFGDTRYRVITSYVNRAYVSDANRNGKIKDRENLIVVDETLTMNYRFQARNYFQYGVEFNTKMVTSESLSNNTESSGISDTFFSASYEFLPEIAYHRYKPRGFFTLSAGIPIGRSKYEYESIEDEQAISSGLYSIAPGLVFFKKVNRFDFSATVNTTIYFKDSFKTSSEVLSVSRRPDVNFGLNSAYTFKNVPFIFSLGLFHQIVGKEKLLSDDFYNVTPGGYVTSANAAISYFFNQASIAINYRDDTLLNLASNRALSKTIIFSYTFFDQM